MRQRLFWENLDGDAGLFQNGGNILLCADEFTPEEAQIEDGKIVIYKKLRRD